VAETAGPQGILIERHRDQRGRDRYLWTRRLTVAVLLAIVVAGLANVFGQRPQTRLAVARAATLKVYAPTRVRGGDIFTARVHIFAHAELKQATLILDPGWFEAMTFNGSAPQASQESSTGGRVSFQFGDIPAGGSFVAFLSFQANPNNVGRRAASIELADGSRRIASIHRSFSVWP
jgi:hypothetical protein